MKKQFAYLYGKLLELIEPLEDSLASFEGLAYLFERYGWDVDLSEEVYEQINEVLQLQAPLEALVQAVEDLLAKTLDKKVGVADIKSAATTAKSFFGAVSKFEVNRLEDFVSPLNQQAFWQDIGAHLTDDLVATYLQDYQPKGYALFHFFGIIQQEFVSSSGEFRMPYTRTRIDWERLTQMVGNPTELIRELYGWGGANEFQHLKLLKTLEKVLDSLGIANELGIPRRSFLDRADFNPSADYNIEQEVLELYLPFLRSVDIEDASFLELALALTPIPDAPDQAPQGLLLQPIAQGRAVESFPVSSQFEMQWGIGADASGVVQLQFFPSGIKLDSQTPTIGAGIELRSTFAQPWYVFGDAEGTHLLLRGLDLGLKLVGEIDKPELQLVFKTKGDPGLEAVFHFDEADVFLKDQVASEPVQVGFSPEVRWSSQTGITFNGSPTFETRISLNKQLLGIRLTNFDFALLDTTSNGRSQIALRLGTGLKGEIGPVHFAVESMGATVALTPYNASQIRDEELEEDLFFGNLGLSLSYSPPTGLGFIIDAKAVKGGGFLDFKPDKGEYLGYAELEVLDKVNVKAIGLINTKLPDGQSGYSFLLMIVSEFDPLQLGLGFTLESVGGIIGLHRALHLENLRAGVRSDQFDHILFPDDTLANLSRILAGVNQLMPIRKDRYAFGLLGRFGWGSPKLLDIQAGLLFELPSWKLALIGVAKAEVKRKKKTLVRLQLDFAMTYDPAETFFSFDARLKNSKLLVWELSGDFAIRIRGGNDPQFLISAGGFHPDYQPPASLKLPSLERLKIAMKTGNPSIQAQAFFAITSNTFQFGAEAIAKFSKYGIKLEAELGFAALFQFDPLYFKAALWGGVELNFWGLAFGLSLRGTVEGPYPIKIDAYVKFKIWIFSKTVRIPTITIGESGSPALSKVAVWPLLEQQLADDRNWTTELPSRRRPLVTLKSIPDATATVRPIRMHPLGVLEIVQTQVPLQVHLDRFGAQQPGDYHQFSLQLAQTHSTTSPVRRHFAPAQFFDLSEAERFQRPAFESYPAGLRLDGWEKTSMGAVVHTTFDYERKIIVDKEVQQYHSRPMRARYHDQLLNNTSQARARDGQRDRRRAQREGHFVKRPTVYVVFDPHTDEQLAVGQSWAEADQLRREWERTHPRTQGRLQVVLQSELEMSVV